MNVIEALSDEDVVEVVRTQDKEMYREIVKRYQARLMRYATSILGDSQQATDAVQQAFIKAYINLQGFDRHKKFSSWIYRIVHNESLNLVSSKHQWQTEEGLDGDSGVNLEDTVIKQELLNHTHACLAQLPLLYREPVVLFFLEDKSYDEISDILRIPIGTVGTRINRGKLLMKKICQRKK